MFQTLSLFHIYFEILNEKSDNNIFNFIQIIIKNYYK